MRQGYPVHGDNVNGIIEAYKSPDGKVCGIELLNANEQLQIIGGGKFILTNESTGKTMELPVGIK